MFFNKSKKFEREILHEILKISLKVEALQYRVEGLIEEMNKCIKKDAPVRRAPKPKKPINSTFKYTKKF